MTNSLLLFLFSVEIDYEPVGCFKDKRGDRSLKKLVKNYRKPKNLGGKKLWHYWPDEMDYVIQLCAEEAFKQGYRMVALQFYGECYSGKDAGKNYDKYGRSKNCINSVGKENANYVYRIKGKWTGASRPVVSHTFVFVYMRVFINYNLFGAYRNEGNHCESTRDN